MSLRTSFNWRRRYTWLKHPFARSMCTQSRPQTSNESLPSLPLGGFSSLLLLPRLLSGVSFGLTWVETASTFYSFPRNSPSGKISRVKKNVLGNQCLRKQPLGRTGFNGKISQCPHPVGRQTLRGMVLPVSRSLQRNYVPDPLSNNLLSTSWLAFFPPLAHLPFLPTGISWDHLPPNRGRIIVLWL